MFTEADLTMLNLSWTIPSSLHLNFYRRLFCDFSVRLKKEAAASDVVALVKVTELFTSFK